MAYRCPRTTAGSSGQADRRAPALELETGAPGKGRRVVAPDHNRCCAVNDHVRGLHRVRTFKTHFCLANQYLEQLTPSVRAAVLGNAGTLMVFRVSSNDAALLAPEFHPLPAPELADQSPFTAWLRRADSERRPIFLEPQLYPSRKRLKDVVAQSRRNFGRARIVIERTFKRD